MRSIANGAVDASLDESGPHPSVLDAIAPLGQPARGDLRCRFAMRAGRKITSFSIAVVAGVGQNMQAGILCQLFQNPRITANIRRRAIDKCAHAALFGGEKKGLHASHNLFDVPSIATGLLRTHKINHHVFVRQCESQRRRRDWSQHRVYRRSCLRRSGSHEVDCCHGPEELQCRAAGVLMRFRDSPPFGHDCAAAVGSIGTLRRRTAAEMRVMMADRQGLHEGVGHVDEGVLVELLRALDGSDPRGGGGGVKSGGLDLVNLPGEVAVHE